VPDECQFEMRRRLLLRLGLLATAEHIEDDVEKQTAAAEKHGWGEHQKSPFPWDVKKCLSVSDGRGGKGRATERAIQ